MTGYFIWNGVKSTQFGIYVSEHPAVTFPGERVGYVNVPGRSGSLALPEGQAVYDDMTLTAQCWIQDDARINEIGQWLRGAGEVEFGNRPGGHYKARIANQIPFVQILRGKRNRSFAVSFRCKPFWYVNSDPEQVLTSAGFVLNEGNVPCEPLISVTASGDFAITVGLQRIEVTGGSIIIDSELRDCLNADGASLANNRAILTEFPVLESGLTSISWTGSVSSVSIKKRVRNI